MRMRFSVAWPVVALVAAVLVSGCCSFPCCERLGGGSPGWRAKLAQDLPVFGHRNWICVVDSAYPAQSRAGIDTLATGESQLQTVQAVLEALAKAPHVQPVVYLDAELERVPEADAPGVEAYRKALKELLGQRPVQTLPHEEIIAKLDDAAKTFRVLILKTDLTVPYTSVFFQLDCGYWGPEKEKRLREAMGK
jgi:L-fucose mutarotase/ribose pyranase (RbsD/FucU family)